MPQWTHADLAAARERDASTPSESWVKVGLSTCGIAAGALDVFSSFKRAVRERNLPVAVKRCGCVGQCYAEPTVEVSCRGQPSVLYQQVSSESMQEIVEHHLVGGRVLEKYRAPATSTKQQRIVLRNCGVIDPESIRDYVARDGYAALSAVLRNQTPEEVIEEISGSGLRGRGGAGYSTGTKWRLTAREASDQKYMICNADEGDPGAYMDRSVLEGDPHSVLEGMTIAGYAIGANKGYCYVRAEYPLAIERVEKAIKQAKALGLLGANVLGSSFSFDVEVRLGAGAFVCGEETALIASIEGKRGTPKPRPPYPSVRGLWGKLTCINNVETLANVATIVRNGASWFANIGFGASTGTKVFALTGKVLRSGLIEVPMGTRISDIVYELGGGAPNGARVKAVQTGGPSGGVIPEQFFDTPISYESLLELGSIMGSGGMIVMDESDSMVEIAKFYLGFCVDESCGKCAPCRNGGKQMLSLLESLTAGNASSDAIEKIKKIARAMQKASLCGLGQTAPNPVLSTLKYFGREYESLLST